MEEKSKIIELPKILDKRGNLSFIESLRTFRLKLNGRIGFMMFRVVRLVAVMLI